MHVPDGFLDASTSLATGATAGAAVGFALRRSRRGLDDRTAPMAGLAATFVFAAQLLNFPVGAGTSGHLLGGTLVAKRVGTASYWIHADHQGSTEVVTNLAAAVVRTMTYRPYGSEASSTGSLAETRGYTAQRTDDTSSANDWLRRTPPWEARVCTTLLLTVSSEEAAARSRARREALSTWPQSFAHADFAWVTPPVLNPFTRIAVEMCAANGTLRAVGYELEAGSDLPRRVTQVRELAEADARLPA